MMVNYLVGGIPIPLENMKVSWDDFSQYMETYGKIKNVPNHQVAYVRPKGISQQNMVLFGTVPLF
jgi:transposase